MVYPHSNFRLGVANVARISACMTIGLAIETLASFATGKPSRDEKTGLSRNDPVPRYVVATPTSK